jgi:LacI family transcriptional regulator
MRGNNSGSSTPRNSRKPVGIKEIAEALDVSIGTVDRALHSRPGINPMTRAKVLKMAQTMGYRPNLAARFLKSQRQLMISVLLPTEIASFFDALRDGIREASEPFGHAVRVEFRSYPSLGDGDVALFQESLENGTQGMIIAPGEPAIMRPLIRKAARRNVPVVCVATDAPGTERLTAITACSSTNGAIVGELLGRVIHGKGKLAVVTGRLTTEDHADKLEGFQASLKQLGTPLEVVSVIEAHDDERLAYSSMKGVIERNPDLRGVYVSTANSLPVLQAIEEAGLGRKLAVITTDLFPLLVPLIRSGRVLATVHQRPLTQGRMAFQALHQFLIEGKCPPPRIRVAPHIVMNSNLDLFLERLPRDVEEQESMAESQIWVRPESPALA